jgi:DNA helicase II / ATP-dependent DNA helicase PcrA
MYNNTWQSSIPSRFVAELPGSDVDVKAETGLWGSGPDFADDSYARRPQSYGARRSPLIEAKAVEGARAGSDFMPGMRVFHEKFGYGRVLAAESGKLEVEFEHSGAKKVMDSFVRKA